MYLTLLAVSAEILEGANQVTTLAGALTACLVLGGIVVALVRGGPSQVKSFLLSAWKMFFWATSIFHGPWTISKRQEKLQELLVELNEQFLNLTEDVECIKSENMANGWTSQKDISLLLLGQWKSDKRRSPHPLFLRDGDGKNIVVSRAYCQLVGLSEEDGLLGLNWKRFIFHEDVDSYVKSFLTAAETRSSLRAVGRFLDIDSNPLGTWEAIGEVLIKDKRSRLVYEGFLRPLDELAKKISAERGFIYPRSAL